MSVVCDRGISLYNNESVVCDGASLYANESVMHDRERSTTSLYTEKSIVSLFMCDRVRSMMSLYANENIMYEIDGITESDIHIYVVEGNL